MAKTRMFKYFTAKRNSRYIDILPELVKGCNNSYHRSIKMRPIDVKVMLDTAQQNTLEAYERGVIRDMWVPVIIERAPLHPKKGVVKDGRHNGRGCGGFLIQHETTSSNSLTPPEKLQASQIA